MCICSCDTQKISPNEFHLAGWWTHWRCFDHNARLSAPHHGKTMYSLLLYVRWLCSTTQCASSSKTTYVQHGWKVNSIIIQQQPLWLLVLKHGQFHHLKATSPQCLLWHCCNLCNVSCGRLFSWKEKLTSERAIAQIKPIRFPSPKTKSFGVIPESSTKAES